MDLIAHNWYSYLVILEEVQSCYLQTSYVFLSKQRPHQGEVYDEQGWCSPKFMQFLIVILVVVMILR